MPCRHTFYKVTLHQSALQNLQFLLPRKKHTDEILNLTHLPFILLQTVLWSFMSNFSIEFLRILTKWKGDIRVEIIMLNSRTSLRWPDETYLQYCFVLMALSFRGSTHCGYFFVKTHPNKNISYHRKKIMTLNWIHEVVVERHYYSSN